MTDKERNDLHEQMARWQESTGSTMQPSRDLTVQEHYQDVRTIKHVMIFWCVLTVPGLIIGASEFMLRLGGSHL